MDGRKYELKGCPYCAKVRWALANLDLDYRPHAVPSSRSNRMTAYEVCGRYEVPVLVDRTNGINGLAESDNIATCLYDEFGKEDESPPSGVVGWLRTRYIGG